MHNYINEQQYKHFIIVEGMSDLPGLDVGRLLYEAFVAVALRQRTWLDLHPDADTLTRGTRRPLVWPIFHVVDQFEKDHPG